jgi:glucose 1-dehydrogenase
MLNTDLAGKPALVTGANSGIGAAIAMKLAWVGADVAINYVAEPGAAAKVADPVRRFGRQTLVIEADISDAAQVAKMFATLDEAWSGIDILVNNAGVDGKSEPAWQCELDAVQTVAESPHFHQAGGGAVLR